jgi:hypothetical protein
MQGSDQLSLPSATTRWTNRARSAACFAAFVPAVILNNQALPEILSSRRTCDGRFQITRTNRGQRHVSGNWANHTQTCEQRNKKCSDHAHTAFCPLNVRTLGKHVNDSRYTSETRYWHVSAAPSWNGCSWARSCSILREAAVCVQPRSQDRFHDPRTREGVAPVMPIEVGCFAGQAAVPFSRPDVPKYH